jgi:predicted nucleotide-binding protein (sugar kinase/HSP70/actin superfamily)
MTESGAEFAFLPMLRSVPTVNGEHHAIACPIVQASPDLVCWDLAGFRDMTVVSPVIDLRAGLDDSGFLAACGELAKAFGVNADRWRQAHARAVDAQREFDLQCGELGTRALAFCRDHDVTPVVVMGRPYTIHNSVLNSNVPAILREQGAIGIPLDCYPVRAEVPSFGAMYWAYGQRILRAAHQVRRTDSHYSLYCSNYACGPDSFNLHFYAHVMAGKPFAVIETDGHSGDAGTKTRVEAFLHCVAQDRQRTDVAAAHDFSGTRASQVGLRELLGSGTRMLMPWMTDMSEAVAACLRGRGIAAECLPPPDDDALRQGRRQTSGKECLPMALTLGSLLQRLERAAPDDRFVYLQPSTNGPCRFGVYGLLDQIVLERLGWADRVRLWSPCDTGYFDEFPASMGVLAFAGIVAADLLNEAVITISTEETRPGAARAIYQEARGELLALIERRAAEDIPTAAALWQVASGRMFGLREVLAKATARFAACRDGRTRPTVLLTGEIYVRCVPFANDFVAERLGNRGLRVRLTPIQELLDYADNHKCGTADFWRLGARLNARIRTRIRGVLSAAVDGPLGWPARHSAAGILAAARPYLRDALEGEAVQTLGGSLLAWHHGQIHGVVSAGPHECMPNKIAESQFVHMTEREGLPSLTLMLNGDPLDNEVLDNFAFEVNSRYHQHGGHRGGLQPPSRHTGSDLSRAATW